MEGSRRHAFHLYFEKNVYDRNSSILEELCGNSSIGWPYSGNHSHSIENSKCNWNRWPQVGRGQVDALNHQRQCGHSYVIGQQSQNSNQNRTQAVIRIWLVNHGIVVVKQVSSLNSYLICRSRKVLGWVNRTLTQIIKIKSPSPSVNSQTWATYRISRGRINITQGFTSSIGIGDGCIGDRFITFEGTMILLLFLFGD